MQSHRWLARGTARMTPEQAAEWAGASGMAVETPLEMHVDEVVCRDCGVPILDQGSPCLGVDPERAHHCIVIMTLEMNEEEARGWWRGEDLEPVLRPQAVRVLCVLCGQNVEEADRTCPERATEDDPLEIDGVEGERDVAVLIAQDRGRLHYRLADDGNGERHAYRRWFPTYGLGATLRRYLALMVAWHVWLSRRGPQAGRSRSDRGSSILPTGPRSSEMPVTDLSRSSQRSRGRMGNGSLPCPCGSERSDEPGAPTHCARHGVLAWITSARCDVPWTRRRGKEGAMSEELVERLRDLGVQRGILVQLARDDQILKVRCEMPFCYHRGGREDFERRSRPPSEWELTVDHHPRLKMHGGHLSRDNVRLAHRVCNNADYAWRTRIAPMLASGKSLAEIADRLETQRVPRPHGHPKWTPALVRKAFIS